MTLADTDTDIASLVGDMPAKACECPSGGCPHGDKCDGKVKWAARAHIADGWNCQFVQLYLCDFCLNRASRVSQQAVGRTCGTCGVTMRSVDDMVGPVIPV